MFECLRLNEILGSNWDTVNCTRMSFIFGRKCSWRLHYFGICQKVKNKEENKCLILFEVSALSVLKEVFWARKKSTLTFQNTSEWRSPDRATGDLNIASLSDCLLEDQQRQGEVYQSRSSSRVWDTCGQWAKHWHKEGSGAQSHENTSGRRQLMLNVKPNPPELHKVNKRCLKAGRINYMYLLLGRFSFSDSRV